MFVCKCLTMTWFHRKDFLRQDSTMLPLVLPWITGKICLKSTHSSMRIPPIGQSLPVKSLSVQSKASNASLFVMGASSTTVA